MLVDAERRVFVGGVGPFEEAMGPECIRLGKGLRIAMGGSASPRQSSHPNATVHAAAVVMRRPRL